MVICNVTSNFSQRLKEATNNGTKHGIIGITNEDAYKRGNIAVELHKAPDTIIVTVDYCRRMENDLPDPSLRGVCGWLESPNYKDSRRPYPKNPVTFSLANATFHTANNELWFWVDDICDDIIDSLDICMTACNLIADSVEPKLLADQDEFMWNLHMDWFEQYFGWKSDPFSSYWDIVRGR